jgi:AraC-like DNA-binding protein
MFFTFFDSQAMVKFQESFEKPNPDYYSYETKTAQIVNIDQTKAMSIDLKMEGYFRFKVPSLSCRSAGFAFYPKDWKNDSAVSITFLQAFLYDTTAMPLQYGILFSVFLERANRGGPFTLGIASFKGDTLRFSSVVAGSFNSFSMNYVFNEGALFDCRISVNNLSRRGFAIPVPHGNFFVLTFGAMSSAGVRAGTSGAVLLDNIVLSDDTATISQASFVPPAFKAEPVDTNRIAVTMEARPDDSLGLLELSEQASFVPLLFSRSLAASKIRPYLLDFPLKPGDYFLRMAAVKKDGLLTDYSPELKVTVAGIKDFQKKLIVEDVRIVDEITDKPTQVLVPDQWYVLNLKLSTVSGCFALFYLHHAGYTLGGPYNKGGYFDRKENYIFNLSFGSEDWLYASREDVKGRSIRVDGQKYVYIDDADSLFRPDRKTNTLKVRFQLLKEALPGDWMLSGYMERDGRDERSFLYTHPYKVLSEREIALKKIAERKKAKGLALGLAFILAALAAMIFAYRYYRKKKGLRAPELSLLSQLRERGIFIRDVNHRHRHIIQRAQSFILENLDKDISLSDIAAAQDLTGTWVGIVFKEATGYTVVQFINKVKIEKAKELLAQGTLSATDVAMSVGYSSLDHFRRVFKEQTGKTPSDYRKSPLNP